MTGDAPRVALFTEAALNRKHGTGAQLLRYLDGLDVECAHVHFLGWAGWDSVTPRSLPLEPPAWRKRSKLIRGLARRLGLDWWSHGRLSGATRAAILAHAAPCDVAWVVVGGERGARVARRVVAELGAPVLLHVMDLYADSLDTCPHFRALAASARGIITLTPNLSSEFKRSVGRDCLEIGVGQHTDVPLALPPDGNGWTLFISGRTYPESLTLLADALHLLTPSRRPSAIFYAGTQFAAIPEALRRQVVDLGFIGDPPAYARAVAARHVAYLQLPAQLDAFGRYSYPSRATDYLMAGLPVIGHCPEGGAAAAVLRAAHPGVRLGHGGARQLAEDLAAVVATPASWALAHRAARAFAERHIDIVPQRAAIRAELARCALSREK